MTRRTCLEPSRSRCTRANTRLSSVALLSFSSKSTRSSPGVPSSSAHSISRDMDDSRATSSRNG